MTIGNASSGGKLQAQRPAVSGGGNVAQLEQQKKALQDEIKRVKGDDKLQPDAKKKKLATLEKKMQKIEEAIQRASADETKNVSSQSSPVSKKADGLAGPGRSKNPLQNSEAKELSEQMRKSKLGEAGNLLDVYA